VRIGARIEQRATEEAATGKKTLKDTTNDFFLAY
jgi:hypothetical protein